MTKRLPRQEPKVHSVVTKMQTRAMLIFLVNSNPSLKYTLNGFFLINVFLSKLSQYFLQAPSVQFWEVFLHIIFVEKNKGHY
jgi:hypothetical protein